VDLWNLPNDYQTRMDFEPSVAMSLDVDGNAYVLKLRDMAGRIKRLLWLSHTRLAPIVEDGEVTGYAVDGITSNPLKVEDVIHFRRGCDPDNPFIGISALKAQLRQVATDNEAATFTASIMRNMGIAGTVITPDDPSLRPTAEDAQAVKKGFDSVTNGDGRGSTVVLMGKYKVTQPGFSPEQLCLKDLPRDAASRLAASLGTPLMALGLPDPDKTYSNLEEAIRTAWDGIKGTQRLIADGLRWNLLPDFKVDPKTDLIEYNYDEIQECQESLDSLWTRLGQAYKDGLLMRAEGRELLGLPPVKNGDCWYPGTGGDAEPKTTQALQMQESSPVTGALDDQHAPQSVTPAANGNGKPKIPVVAGKGYYS
jgi:HK97 family phage portal protein